MRVQRVGWPFATGVVVLGAVGVCALLEGCALSNDYPPVDREDTLEACTNREDDDLDGATDCQSDVCRAFGVCVETEMTDCNNRLDDDGDGLSDSRDPGCFHLAPPTLTRCASSAGTNLDSTVSGIESIGLSGPLMFEPSVLEPAGRRLLTARGSGGRMFLLAPLTGALTGLTLRFDVLLREDDQVVANLVPASAVDASRGWDGFGALATMNIAERVYSASVQLVGGRLDEAALPRGIGDLPRWHTMSLRLQRSPSGGYVATLEVLDGEGMRLVTTSSETMVPLIEDETLFLVLDLTPSPRFPSPSARVVQVDNLAITRPRHDPCGSPVPVAAGPSSIGGVVRIPDGACMLGIQPRGDTGMTELAAYRLEGARLIDTGERIALSGGSHPGRVAMELEVAGGIRAVVSGHDAALRSSSILARLHTLRARPDCTGWTEERVDDTPDGRRPQSTTTALSGGVLSVVGIHSSGRLAIERWSLEEDRWTSEGRGEVLTIPGEAEDLFGYTAVALAARSEELVLVYRRSSEAGFWLSVLPRRSNEWTTPIPWQGPSGEEGTFDVTSVVGGALLLDPGRAHYVYDASYPLTACTRCGVGFSRAFEVLAPPCPFGTTCDAGVASDDAGPTLDTADLGDAADPRDAETLEDASTRPDGGMADDAG